jgi:hypothetical protein
LRSPYLSGAGEDPGRQGACHSAPEMETPDRSLGRAQFVSVHKS